MAARPVARLSLRLGIWQQNDYQCTGQADQGRSVCYQPIQDDQHAIGQVDRQVGQEDAKLVQDGHGAPAGSKVTRVT